MKSKQELFTSGQDVCMNFKVKVNRRCTINGTILIVIGSVFLYVITKGNIK